MVDSVGSYGTRLDFKLRQGASFGPYKFIVKNPDGTFVDISQIEIRGQMRKTNVSSEFISFIVTKTNELQGEFEIYLPENITKNIQAGSNVESIYSLWYYDLELDSGLGQVTPFVYGEIKVLREITK
jgi:hypothetical protein